LTTATLQKVYTNVKDGVKLARSGSAGQLHPYKVYNSTNKMVYSKV